MTMRKWSIVALALGLGGILWAASRQNPQLMWGLSGDRTYSATARVRNYTLRFVVKPARGPDWTLDVEGNPPSMEFKKPPLFSSVDDAKAAAQQWYETLQA
jgi:hypothetical protein